MTVSTRSVSQSLLIEAAMILPSLSNAGPPFYTKPAGAVLVGLTKAEAEAVLDWLEGHGCRDPELRYTAGLGFMIRFRERLATSWANLSRWRQLASNWAMLSRWRGRVAPSPDQSALVP